VFPLHFLSDKNIYFNLLHTFFIHIRNWL